MLDDLIVGFDRALRTLSGVAASGRTNPAAGMPEPALTADERRHAAGLMRVNHTGEVCAQALYQAQALTARDSAIRLRFAHAAREVEEHLSGHMDRLPPGDFKSRAIVAAMRDDEMRHGAAARDSGAADLPWLARALMRGVARLMTLTAYRL